MADLPQHSRYAALAFWGRDHVRKGLNATPSGETPVVMVGQVHNWGTTPVNLAAALGACADKTHRVLAIETDNLESVKLSVALNYPRFLQYLQQGAPALDKFPDWAPPSGGTETESSRYSRESNAVGLLSLLTAHHLGYVFVSFDDDRKIAASLEDREDRMTQKLDRHLAGLAGPVPDVVVVATGANHIPSLHRHFTTPHNGFHAIALTELDRLKPEDAIREKIEPHSYQLAVDGICKLQGADALHSQLPSGRDLLNAMGPKWLEGARSNKTRARPTGQPRSTRKKPIGQPGSSRNP